MVAWLHFFIGIFILIILIIALIVSGTYAIKSSLALSSKIYKQDADLKSAHDYLVWASVVAWGSIGSAVLLIIFGVIGGVFLEIFGGAELEAAAAEAAAEAEEAGETGVISTKQATSFIEKIVKLVMYILIFVVAVLGVVTGYLCAVAASKMRGSPLYSTNSSVKTAFNDAVIGAAAGFTVIGIVIIIILYHFIQHERMKKKQKEKQAEQRSAQQTLELVSRQALAQKGYT